MSDVADFDSMLDMEFNANDVEPAAPFELVPAGKYAAQIVKSEMRTTSNGDGRMLWLELEILDERFRNRRIWDQINLINPSSQTVEIAKRTLSAICHATGVMTFKLSNHELLQFKPLTLTVRVRPAGKDKKGVYRDAQSVPGGYAVLGAPAGQASQGNQFTRQAPSGAAPNAAAASATQTSKAPPPWASRPASA